MPLIRIQVSPPSVERRQKQHPEFRKHGFVPVFLLAVHSDQYSFERWATFSAADDIKR